VTNEKLSPEELRATTLKGLRSTLIARPTVEIILLGSMVVLARLISPADFGRYAIAVLVAGLGVVALTSLDAALVQRPEIDRSHLQAGFALALMIAVGFSILALIAASVLIAPIFGERTADFVRISTIGTFIAGFNVIPAALVQRGLAIKRLSILDVSGSVAYAAVSIGFAVAGFHGYALVFGGIAQALTTTVVNWVWAPQPLPRLHRRAARELMRFGLPQSVAALAWVGFANIDYAIVGARLGAREAGFYSRAYTIGVNYKQKITQVMTSVGFPVLARTQSSEEMSALRCHMVRLLTLTVFPLLVVLAVTAPVLVPWVFGLEWKPAVLPTQILAVGGATTLAIDAAGAVLMAEGRSRALLGFGWAHFVSYAGLVWIGASFGIVAVSIAASVDHAIFLVVAYVVMLRQPIGQALRRLWEDVGPAVVCCLACAAVAVPISVALSTLMHAPPVPYLAAVTIPAAIAYVLTLKLCFPEPWRTMRVFAEHVLPQRRPSLLRRVRVPPAPGVPPVVGGGETSS
jgi:lipopolysaccharide exporter